MPNNKFDFIVLCRENSLTKKIGKWNSKASLRGLEIKYNLQISYGNCPYNMLW